ncbi:MAG: glucose 1-dehydrogenase [Rhizobiaceae bacterium]
MNRLDNKVALITGGARGQGAAEAEMFVSAGAQVVITDIDRDLGSEVAEGLGETCLFLSQDVASEDDWQCVVEEIVARFGQIDSLVNNAGIFRVQELEQTSAKDWNQMLAINQTGVFFGMKAVAPHMKKAGKGSIINLSSIAGLGGAKAFAYAATKWAVRGMTKSAALELAPFGVRVNSVHPGLIETQMMDAFGVPREEIVARVPYGRLGDVDEIAKLVLFLASDDSSYCTGHEFIADGAVKA